MSIIQFYRFQCEYKGELTSQLYVCDSGTVEPLHTQIRPSKPQSLLQVVLSRGQVYFGSQLDEQEQKHLGRGELGTTKGKLEKSNSWLAPITSEDGGENAVSTNQCQEKGMEKKKKESDRRQNPDGDR